jgi:Phloem protein 2
VSWIEIRGMLDIAELKVSQPICYEIIYLIKFKPDSFGWDHTSISFEAGTSNSAKKKRCFLLEPYREQFNKLHEVSGGRVEVKPDMRGYLEFGMSEVETKWWKGGVVFEGVKISPINK